MKNSRILIPGEFCRMDAVKYIARRYNSTPEELLYHFLVQERVICDDRDSVGRNYDLMSNEVGILRDLGIRPSEIEIEKS